MPKRLLQVTVSLMYAFSFMSKLNAGWFTGDIMRAFAADGSIKGTLAPVVLAVVPLQLLSLGTLLAEALLSIGWWFPRLKKPTLVTGVGMHLVIDLLMAVRTFSLQMYVLYFLFREERAPESRPSAPSK